MIDRINILTLANVAISDEKMIIFLIVGSVSALIFGMGKVGFGGGVGILSVPVMIYACGGDAMLAAGIMLPLLIAADYVGIASWWRLWDISAVYPLIPGACIGIAGGWVLLHFMRSSGTKISGAWLGLAVGIISIIFVLLRVVQWLQGKKWKFRPVLWMGVTGGALIGFVSALAHAAGPVASMYLLSMSMPKKRFVATTVLLFWIINQIKVIPYLHLGMIETRSIMLGLYLVPAAILGSVLGKWLNSRVNQRFFSVIVYTLLTAAGIHLIFKAVSLLM